MIEQPIQSKVGEQHAEMLGAVRADTRAAPFVWLVGVI